MKICVVGYGYVGKAMVAAFEQGENIDYDIQNPPEDFKTPEELFRENQLMDLRDDLETQRYSPDSMIILNPEDIRSPNAAYDVDKRDSYDIMSDAGALAGIQDTGVA